MIFLTENVIWIVCVIAALGAAGGILEITLRRTRGVLAAISLLFNAVGITLAFIGGMEILTLVAIMLGEFLVLAVVYALRT